MRTFISGLTCLLVIGVVRAGTLEDGFKNPPNSARPECWWHWMNGNVTREGITADLEGMKRIGLGGFTAFSVTDAIPRGPVDYMSEQWLSLMEHAAKEADRLGLEMCMHNCAGWSSSGGPWITPEMSMQEIVWTESSVSGGKTVEVKLAQPQTRKDFYRDIIVVAFPKVGDFRLSDWEWKIDRNVAGRKPDSQIARDTRTPPQGDVIKLDRIVMLSDKMDASGNLKWDAPAGNWTIIRFGHTTTGRVNKPAPKEGEGLECDKLSRAAAKLAWDNSVARVAKQAGPLAGKSFNNVLIDSYEVGFTDWTEGFDKIFAQRLGYEMTRYMPCLTGRVVESVDTSERFLWDFRRLIADLMAENYFGYFGELCHANGMKLSIEPYGPGGFDDYQIAAIADVPMGEFWVNRPDAWHQWSMKLAASAAHARGLGVAGAESFTASPPASAFADHPYMIKPLGDFAFAQGISRYIFHTSVHQPWVRDDVLPGMTMGPHGIQLNRDNTWHKVARPWMDSLARTQFMLQQGNFVADLCYVAAEDAPQTPPRRSELKPAPPEGYDYDMLHYSFVMQMSVKDGGIVLPSGMSYSVLVLPDSDHMRPELLAKVVELQKAGAKVFVPRKIVASPSLVGGEASDAKVKQLSGQLVMAKSLEGMLTPPDVGLRGNEHLVWLHRRADDRDIYFVANQDRQENSADLIFNARGATEIWRTLDGKIEQAGDSLMLASGTTNVKLKLEPAESVFVVFGQKSSAPVETQLARSSEKTIGGPWSLAFPAGWGAPEKVELPKLISWTEHDNGDAKHFSGTAVYSIQFNVPAENVGKAAMLDLGDVQVMATVKVNGKDLGLLWKPPFKVDVSQAIKAGTNELEISVTNLWVNRLIGDAAYPPLVKHAATTRRAGAIAEIPEWLLKNEPKPPTRRKTFATYNFYKASDPLLPSGLIGPVKVEFGKRVEVSR